MRTKKQIRLVLVHCLLSKNSSPHIGLLSLAAYVRKYLKWVDIRVIESLDPLEEILTSKSDIIGFTSDTMAYCKTVEVALKVKKIDKKAIIMIGGVHITACPKCFDLPFDFGVVGEGELTLEELLNNIKNNKDITGNVIRKIRGIVYLKKGKIVINPKREFIKDIDSLPIPARDMVNMEELYLKNQVNLYGVKRMVNLMTSRGCPYHCIYCGSPVQWGTVRFHSAEYIIKEIKWIIRKYKADGIVFSDDLFIVPKERILKLVELIIKEGWQNKIIFSGFSKANVIDDDICKALTRINVRKLTFGFESYNEKTLKYLKDGTVSVKQNFEAIKICRKYGIAVASGLIVGTPGEGIKELTETYGNMKKYPMDNSQIYILTPYPGTKIWATAERFGLVSMNMNMEKLFVQIPIIESLKFWKKDRFDFLKDRVFLNMEMRNNQKYLRLILNMNLLAFWQNMKYYFKMSIEDPGLILRLANNFFFSG